MKLGKITKLCWEGLTLKHVTHPKIVVPYLLYVFTAFLFELFLMVLFGVSCFLFYQYGYSPDFVFIVSGAILILIFLITVLMLRTTISRHKNVFLKGSHESSLKALDD